jgi:hypothetical protein
MFWQTKLMFWQTKLMFWQTKLMFWQTYIDLITLHSNINLSFTLRSPSMVRSLLVNIDITNTINDPITPHTLYKIYAKIKPRHLKNFLILIILL